MSAPRVALIEFPADDTDRALRFWAGLLGRELEPRQSGEGEGWVSRPPSGEAALGVHARGRGPGDSFSLPYIEVGDIAAAMDRVTDLGGQLIHPGEHWAICRDSEGSPFALAAAAPQGDGGEGDAAGSAPSSEAPPELELQPLAEQHAEPLREIRRAPAVAERWEQLEPDFPWEEPEIERLAILWEGRVAGMIQFEEELDPTYRQASIDLFVDPGLHGRGIGTAAVREGVRILTAERGHHRITIDPAADNAAAIRSYEKAGFRPVGVMRKAERDADGSGWHDSLLMELVVEAE
jgi:RimJ/RimL family protein N-acetyltransferase/predicted enzyme related to lactoylglutathione lyase